MTEIEYELTYLAKYIPKEIKGIAPKRVTDYYVPEHNAEHPHTRIRSKGSDTFELTKKQPVHGADSSEQTEHTIALSEDEYADLVKGRTRVVSKDRYFVEIAGHPAEVDVFLDGLAGLVLIDFEFENNQAKNDFTAPDICLADVTQEAFIAGGILAGKSYPDIEPFLQKYDYKQLVV